MGRKAQRGSSPGSRTERPGLGCVLRISSPFMFLWTSAFTEVNSNNTVISSGQRRENGLSKFPSRYCSECPGKSDDTGPLRHPDAVGKVMGLDHSVTQMQPGKWWHWTTQSSRRWGFNLLLRTALVSEPGEEWACSWRACISKMASRGMGYNAFPSLIYWHIWQAWKNFEVVKIYYLFSDDYFLNNNNIITIYIKFTLP